MPSEKSTTADLEILSPAVRRALMLHEPEYFKMSAEEREAQRAVWAGSPHSSIRSYLIEHALGKTKQEVAAIDTGDARLSIAQNVCLNSYTQQIHGIGQDFFSWNEWLADGVTALSFETIGAYDRDCDAFQQKCRAESDPSYEPKPYRGQLAGEWARYLKQGQVRYASLFDLGAFVGAELESFGSDILSTLVPHKYVRGSEDGAVGEGGFRLLDRRLDADGFESLHDALRSEYTRLIAAQVSELREAAWTEKSPKVWEFNDEEWQEQVDPQGATVVFASPAAMDRVRQKSFLADCAACAGEISELRSLVKAQKDQLQAAMHARHEELKPLHPKGLIPFKRKMKVFMAPAALKDLNTLSEE